MSYRNGLEQVLRNCIFTEQELINRNDDININAASTRVDNFYRSFINYVGQMLVMYIPKFVYIS